MMKEMNEESAEQREEVLRIIGKIVRRKKSVLAGFCRLFLS